MQGGSVWVTDVHNVINIEWSPDGRLILCIHQPPRATLRSVHDGKQVGELLLPNTVTRITGAWWIESDEQPPTDELGDLMKRGSNTPGSAHSLLARLPLLEPYKDPLPAKPNPLGAPMTFGLPDPKPAQDWRIPSPVVQGIQSLPPSPMAASLAPIDKVPTRNKPGSTTKDEQVDPNRGTLVVIADSNGLVHLFLDGRYAMGEVRVYPSSTAVRMSGLSKRGSITSFGVYGSCLTSGMTPSTSLTPTLVHVSLATAPETLKVARASSTVKALLEYIHLGIEELEIIWCGRSKDGRGGVKDIGSFWAKIILEKERAHAGRVTRGPIAQLTLLLLTGRATDPLQDFLGGGGKLTDRSINHWEQIVSHALIRMRDYASQRIVPAAERMVIVLEEIRGWAAWPDRYAQFRFSQEAIERCLGRAHRLVAYAQWLAIEAKAELARFVEFIKFMRSEIQKAIEPDLNARPAGQTQAQYDTLEAMAYIEQGLLESALTAWFAGPGPQSYPGELSHATPSTMREAIEQARRALEGKEDATVRKGKEPAQAQGGRSLLAEYPERNVLVIADELAKGCAEVLAVAAGATTRGAQVDGMPVYTGGTDPMPSEETFEERHELVRECTWLSQETIPRPETYVITRVKRDPGREYLCLVRIRPKHEARVQEQASVVIECEVDGVGVEILDIAFFDDNQLLVILRTRGRAHIGVIYYRELGWIRDVRGSQKAVSREELMELVMRHHETNRMDIARLEQTIARSRELQGCGTGTAQLSVNGRRGRRTACVLDSGGVVEVLDMELEGGEEAESESERE
ncbi:Anaphase-promoting complex subunit 4 [Rhizoctonia solani]|uniref:Anaphase-promoting complex subunit 4 n=1 Tax=Rhizoctonia solani TaxID=456999 RepID=A0A0K6GDK4_9AGAM|nr:Anaphase-promoting complex subunit 4 [Rhizoctonia solani]